MFLLFSICVSVHRNKASATLPFNYCTLKTEQWPLPSSQSKDSFSDLTWLALSDCSPWKNSLLPVSLLVPAAVWTPFYLMLPVFWPGHILFSDHNSPRPSLHSHSFNHLRACGSANPLQTRPSHWAWESEIHLPSHLSNLPRPTSPSSAPCASKCHSTMYLVYQPETMGPS